jgi:hypothetical protein
MPKSVFSTAKIRRIFNSEGYLERIQNGEYNERITYKKHRSPPLIWLPVCTWSQRVAYYDKKLGTKVLEVHRYLQPDGKLGASGLPDPKELYHEGVLYLAEAG